MTAKILTIFIGILFLTAINAACDQADDIDSKRATELIRRNVLEGEDRFQIQDPQAYQYGSVHVDGPNGGMLYRFKSDSDTLNWIITRKKLQPTAIGSSKELAIDFLDEIPKWWNPWRVNPSVFYSTTERIATGGERRFIVVFDSSESLIYVVEHYSQLRGV